MKITFVYPEVGLGYRAKFYYGVASLKPSFSVHAIAKNLCNVKVL